MGSRSLDTESLPPITSAVLRRETEGAFERVWDTFLGLPRQFSPDFNPSILKQPFTPAWFGSVAWIGGSWTGNVRIAMEPDLARVITERLLSISTPDEVDVHDSLRELANMVAGNLKSVLPGICGLATPGSFRLRSLDDLSDDFECIVPLWYLSDGLGLLVTLNALHPSLDES